MQLSFESKFNIGDVVFVVGQKWSDELREYVYVACKTPSKIERVGCSIKQKKRPKRIETYVDYSFVDFHKDYAWFGHKPDYLVYKTYEEAKKCADEFNS